MFRTKHFVVLGLLFAATTGCVNQEQYRRALADSENLRDQRDRLAAQNAAIQRRLDELEAQLAARPDQPVDAWQDQIRRLRDELSRLQSGGLPAGVEVRLSEEGIVYDVQGEILFASGRVEVTPAGRTTLERLVAELRGSGKRIRVEGHTDSDPIRNSPWKTNLRLSAERAVVVAESLVEFGIPAERLGVAGYGPHRPKVPGDSDAAKSQNRRVEILLLNEPRPGADSR